MAAAMRIYINNSSVVEVDALRFEGSSNYLNDDAVVECTITDTDGNNIAGESWPVTLDYISASNGRYQATLASTISLTENELYYMIIDVTHDDGNASWRKQVRAYYRS